MRILTEIEIEGKFLPEIKVSGFYQTEIKRKRVIEEKSEEGKRYFLSL